MVVHSTCNLLLRSELSITVCVCVHTFCNQIFSVFFCLVAVRNFVGDVQTLQHCQETPPPPPPSTSNFILSIPWLLLLLCLNLLEQEFLLQKKRKRENKKKKERKKKQKRSNQVVCTILRRFVSLSNHPTVATTCVFQLTRHLWWYLILLDNLDTQNSSDACMHACRLKVLHWSENKVHVEGGKIYLLLSGKIMSKMLFHWKCILVECEAFSTMMRT